MNQNYKISQQDLPPLEKMRKVRRDILKTINDYRRKNRRREIYLDPAANEAADEYAQHLLQNRAWQNPDEPGLEAVSQCFKLVHKQQAIVGYSNIDEESGDMTKREEYLDAHGSLFELEAERETLTDKQTSHVGLGFATDGEKALVVELLSKSALAIEKMYQKHNGSICVQGVNLDPSNAGLFAARIVSASDPSNVASLIGPEHMTYNKATREFTLRFEPQQERIFYNAADPKVLELFVRKTEVDQIQYGSQSHKKIDVNQLTPMTRMPFQLLPDPRIVKEDTLDAE